MHKHEVLKVFAKAHTQPTRTKIKKTNSRGDFGGVWQKIIRKIQYSLLLYVCERKLKLKNRVPSIDFMRIFSLPCDGIWFDDFLTCIVASIFAATLSNIHIWALALLSVSPSLSLVCYSLFMCGFSHLFLFVKVLCRLFNASSCAHRVFSREFPLFSFLQTPFDCTSSSSRNQQLLFTFSEKINSIQAKMLRKKAENVHTQRKMKW